jgi:hypothetical protein
LIFIRVQSCKHIIGTEYANVVSCRYNRRSFVYCCCEAIKPMPGDMMISINDFFCLLQLICRDIPLLLIQESARIGCITSTSAPPTYRLDDFCISLCFRFLFTEWISMLESVFFEGSRNVGSSSIAHIVSSSMLLRHFEEWDVTLPLKISKPPIKHLQSIIQLIVSNSPAHQRGRSVDVEVTYERMMRELVGHDLIRRNIMCFQPRLSLVALMNDS